MASIRLAQINLVVDDVPAAHAFYARLGIPFAQSDPEWRDHHVSAALGGEASFDFELDSVSSASRWNSGWPGGPGVILGFTVGTRDEVDSLVATLAADGVGVQQAPYDAFWGGRYAVVSDPAGNAVGIMSPIDPDRRSAPT